MRQLKPSPKSGECRILAGIRRSLCASHNALCSQGTAGYCPIQDIPHQGTSGQPLMSGLGRHSEIPHRPRRSRRTRRHPMRLNGLKPLGRRRVRQVRQVFREPLTQTGNPAGERSVGAVAKCAVLSTALAISPSVGQQQDGRRFIPLWLTPRDYASLGHDAIRP